VAAICSRNRVLGRLAELSLIAPLKRRIGGVRAGSGSRVWYLAPAGARLLRTLGGFDDLPSRVRAYEPTGSFVEHTLAVAEVCVELTVAERSGETTVARLQREPDCWRTYSSTRGVEWVKPDLAVVTTSGKFEDHWFVEIDRDTEPPCRIIRSCLRYEAYRRSGVEQKRLGLFPGVVWVVPDAKRKATLMARIAQEGRLSQSVYAVVLPDEVLPLMKAGIGSVEDGHGL
jgi:hypothetical protein